MFANSFQSGFLSIFYSVGSAPLGIWDKSVKNGHIRRIVDEEVKSLVLEIAGTNVATTYITCPIKPRASLGVKLPFLVMVVKNMKKYFTFEIQIVDDKDMRRRFRVSNFQSTTKVRPFCTTMPIGLSSGWNQIQFNLADFTRRAYGTVYMETIRVQVHANVRIRRIYFSDRLYTEDELPSEYKLFMPLQKSQEKGKGKAKERGSRDSKELKELKAASGAQIAEQEPVEPSGAPPTPAEPADEPPNVDDEKELAATSMEPLPGDLAPVEEVDGEEVDGKPEPADAAAAAGSQGEVAGAEKGGEDAEGGEAVEGGDAVEAGEAGETAEGGDAPPAEEAAGEAPEEADAPETAAAPEAAAEGDDED